MRTLDLETARHFWNFYNYSVSRYYTKKDDKEYPIKVDLVVESKGNFCRMYYYKDQDYSFCRRFVNMRSIHKMNRDLKRWFSFGMKSLRSSSSLSKKLENYEMAMQRLLHISGTIRSIDRLVREKNMRVEEVLMPFTIVRNRMIAEAKNADLRELYEKYCYLYLGYYDEKISFSEFKREIAQPIAKGKKISESSNYITWAAYTKDLFKVYITRLIKESQPMFREISRKIKDNALDYTKDQLLDMLDGKKAKKLPSEYMIVIEGKNLNFLFGKDIERFKKQHFSQERGPLKGIVANRGFAKGRACIVLGKEHFRKVKKGDALVVINTNPDFVPVMRKACAIIAEEGAITSHVSTVSREFGIPCIIGVRNCTEMLKDGDLVEVDADNGIVRKLSKD